MLFSLVVLTTSCVTRTVATQSHQRTNTAHVLLFVSSVLYIRAIDPVLLLYIESKPNTNPCRDERRPTGNEESPRDQSSRGGPTAGITTRLKSTALGISASGAIIR